MTPAHEAGVVGVAFWSTTEITPLALLTIEVWPKVNTISEEFATLGATEFTVEVILIISPIAKSKVAESTSVLNVAVTVNAVVSMPTVGLHNGHL